MNKLNNKDIKDQINQISKDIYNNTQSAFSDLEKIKLICINIKISVGKLGDNPEARALSTIGDIITESVNKIEAYTMDIKESSKRIGNIISEVYDE